MYGSKDKTQINMKRILFTLIFIFALILGGTNMYYVYNMPTDECGWSDSEYGVKIVSVKTGGSADKAGMKVGDVLLKIAGENAVSSSRAQRVLENQKIGTTVGYLVLRDGEFINLNIEIVKARFHPLYLIMCIVGLVFGMVGIWIVLMRPQDPKARVLFYLFLSFFLFWTFNIVPNKSGLFRIVVQILENFSFILIPIFFLYFFLLYPERHRVLSKKPWIHILLFFPLILLLISFVWILVTGKDFLILISLSIGVGYWGIYFTIGIIRLIRYYKKCTDVHIRQQIRVLKWGILMGIIPPVLMIILPAAFNIDLSIIKYLTPLMIFIPLSFAYAVFRHGLMDIEIIIKKSFVYTLLTGFVIGFYFIIVQIVGRIIQNVSGLTGTFVLIISTLFVAFIFAPVRNKLQYIVDRAFFRKEYDYRQTLRNFATTLNTIIEPYVLMSNVLSNICETMFIDRGCFFIKDDKSSNYHPVVGYPDLVKKSLHIPANSTFCTLMVSKRVPLIISEIDSRDRILTKIKKIIGGVVAIPIMYQNLLSGFIILGTKRSERPYSAEDIELLATLADQVGIALENGKLHEELSEQERIKHELEIARRIQMNSLPKYQPDFSGYDIYGFSIPANEVGGDYYDYIFLSDGRLAVMVGDISGKGTSAALYQSKIQGFIHALIPTIESPKELLCRVNELTLESIEKESFATLSAAFIDRKKRSVVLARAGHTPVIYYSFKNNSCDRWTPPGIGIAIEKGDVFRDLLKEEERVLHTGDILLFYSDGVTEAENMKGEQFGEKRLEDIICTNSTRGAREIGQVLIKRLNNFKESSVQKDDITLVIIKVVN